MAATPLSELVMDGSKDGKPIVQGARVYVTPRPAMEGCGELMGFGGIVKEVQPGCVTLIEFGTFHTRDIRPRDVRVQSGDTKASMEMRASLALAARGGKG
jgi:hypothetical protein